MFLCCWMTPAFSKVCFDSFLICSTGSESYTLALPRKKKLIWICPYIVRTFSSRTVTRIKEKISNKGMIVYLTKIIGRQRYGKQFGELVYTSWEWKGWILCSVLHEKYKDSCHIIYSTYNSMLTPEVWANKNWVIISIN